MVLRGFVSIFGSDRVTRRYEINFQKRFANFMSPHGPKWAKYGTIWARMGPYVLFVCPPGRVLEGLASPSCPSGPGQAETGPKRTNFFRFDYEGIPKEDCSLLRSRCPTN